MAHAALGMELELMTGRKPSTCLSFVVSPAHRERRRRRRVVDLDGKEEVDEEPTGLLTNAGPPSIKDEGS